MSYKKSFRKAIDFYDPHSDEYLLCEHTFKYLFILREKLAELVDHNQELLLADKILLVMARERPKNQAKFDKICEEMFSGKVEEFGRVTEFKDHIINCVI